MGFLKKIKDTAEKGVEKGTDLGKQGIEKGAELGTKGYDGAKDALWWAAMTYVAAALSSLIMLLYLVMRYTSRN